jgi:hypothetical protein
MDPNTTRRQFPLLASERDEMAGRHEPLVERGELRAQLGPAAVGLGERARLQQNAQLGRVILDVRVHGLERREGELATLDLQLHPRAGEE